MLTISPQSPAETCELRVRDSPHPATTGDLFDVLVISGNIDYNGLQVELINASTGETLDRASYTGDRVAGDVISANLSDVDGSFNAGDHMRFGCSPGSISPGRYEIVVVGGGRVVFDGFVELK